MISCSMVGRPGNEANITEYSQILVASELTLGSVNRGRIARSTSLPPTPTHSIISSM